MKPQQVPNREDWGDFRVDEEVEYGYNLFGGKTQAEATPLFADNPIERAAEIRHAPATVFNYYIFCFTHLLTSSESRGESDLASVFLNLVLDRFAREPAGVEGIFEQLRPIVDLVADRQSFYDADIDIYGSFPILRDQIEHLHSKFIEHGA